jgi:hypothetical protein
VATAGVSLTAKRLHKYMLDIQHIDHISDEMRAPWSKSEWPELRTSCREKTEADTASYGLVGQTRVRYTSNLISARS